MEVSGWYSPAALIYPVRRYLSTGAGSDTVVARRKIRAPAIGEPVE